MKQSLLVLSCTAALAALDSSARAQNYPWCAVYNTGDSSSENCGFVNREQCMASVSGIGGYCTPNNTYHPPGPRTH